MVRRPDICASLIDLEDSRRDKRMIEKERANANPEGVNDRGGAAGGGGKGRPPLFPQISPPHPPPRLLLVPFAKFIFQTHLTSVNVDSCDVIAWWSRAGCSVYRFGIRSGFYQ